MNLHAEAVARRYAVRPGCRFIGYRETGLVVFAMNLRVLAVEPRSISPIDEFLLRFLLEGIGSVRMLADLLGLDLRLVRDGLVELRRHELIDVVAESEPDNAECVLTERGKLAARSLRQSVMQEITVPNVIFHGLLRRPVDLGAHARKQYLRPKEAEEKELTFIRAIPNRYPHPEEIDARELDRVVKSAGRHRRAGPDRDIVAVKSVLKKVYTLYEPAVMLEYETADARHERQVAFAVDNQLLDVYETAFAKARGSEILADVLTPRMEPIVDACAGRHHQKSYGGSAALKTLRF